MEQPDFLLSGSPFLRCPVADAALIVVFSRFFLDRSMDNPSPDELLNTLSKLPSQTYYF